jgi:tryptophan synthase alpha chain
MDSGPHSGSRLPTAFEDGPAFVPYLAVGDPDEAASRAYIEALERGGADVIELGLPFSEPIGEGPTIQSAVNRSLSAGMTPERFFTFVEDLSVDIPLVCMTYYNLLHRFGGPDADGPRAFVERAAAVGIDGFVVPDLPVEEAGPLREASEAFGLDVISIVAPTTGDERIERIMARTTGYVYVQARSGVTGAREGVSDQTAATLAGLADYDLPKAVGFGIRTGEHAREVVAAGADGVIVGSALVDIVAEGHEAGTPTEEVANRLEERARELKHGAVRGTERDD